MCGAVLFHLIRMTPPFTLSYPDYTELSDGFALRSPAKVNLSLRVLGKREDGYHELETVFQELDWYDELEFRQSREFTVRTEGADLPSDDSNLVVRAARLLARAGSLPLTGSVVLHKRLPIQGGVGGGSSNAAIALIGLNHLWGLSWPLSSLMPLARELGADCPFFLTGGLARANGRGDIVTPLEGRAEGVFLLVTPPYGSSTAHVFAEFQQRLTEVEKNVIFSPLQLAEKGGVYPEISPLNDLEIIVFHKVPALRLIRDQLLEAGARYALLSGSGSTVFGVFESQEQASEAAHKLAREKVRVTMSRAVARTR